MNSLRLEKVTVKFGYDIILDNINLQFIQGKIYAVLGQSGSGKSTLLNTIANLLPYEGNIFFNNCNVNDINAIDDKVYKTKIINYMQQSPLIFKKIKCKDNLKINNLRNKNLTYSWDEDILTSKYKNKKAKKLSGGENRRLQLSQLLSKPSFIVLADEPTNGLDPEMADLVMNKIVQNNENKIIIFVTHDKEIANKYADEILEIKDGKIKKNYKAVVKDSALDLDQIGKIPNKNKSIITNKYILSENEYTNLFVSSFSTLLMCLTILLSMVFGLRTAFQKQVDESNEDTYIKISKNSNYHSIDEDETEELYRCISFDDLFNLYEFDEIIECNLNGEYIYLPPTLFSSPPVLLNKSLNNNELIISVNTEYKEYLESLLWIDDLEEYLNSNSLEMMFEIYDKEYCLNIIGIEQDDSQEEDILFCHSNKYFNDQFFSETNINKIFAISYEDGVNKYKNFIENNNNYKFVRYDEMILIYKYDSPIDNKNIIIDEYKNIIPLYENEESFFLKYYNGLLYFNNISLLHDGYNVSNKLIYFSPYKQKLLIGRNAESLNEIVISKKLQEELDIPNTLGTIKLKNYKNTINLQVVGITDSNDYYLYQNPSWINKFSNLYLNNDLDLDTTSSYMLVCSPSEVIDKYENINNKYEDYELSSPVYTVKTTIYNLTNNIVRYSTVFELLLAFIVLFSIMLISSLEKKSYSKQIKLLFDNGLDYKEINQLHYSIIIKRGLLSCIVSQSLALILIGIINGFITNIISGLKLEYNVYIFLINILLVLIICLICCFSSRYKKKPKF